MTTKGRWFENGNKSTLCRIYENLYSNLPIFLNLNFGALEIIFIFFLENGFFMVIENIDNYFLICKILAIKS